MSVSTLLLCARCHAGVELSADQLEEVARAQEILGERVVVHCAPCFLEVTRRRP